MVSLMQSKLKIENDARMNEEKKISERNRNLVILIQRHLLNLGYVETVNKLQTESTISLDKWDAADNIDLYMILSEFEQFYEFKFNRPPKLVKKISGEGEKKQMLPKIVTSEKKISQKNLDQSSNNQKEDDPKGKAGAPTSQPTSSKNSKKKPPLNPDKPGEQKNDLDGFEVTGNGIANKEKKNEESDDFFDNRVLKGLPDYANNPELRDLALTLQRDICIENPNVSFNDIVGLEQAKRLLKEAVLLPLKYPQLFQGILEPWRGVLLFGPPGTGKTLLAKAVATECKTTFFNISASSIVSKWRGDSEKLVRVLFDLARHYQPSTIFLDELDSIMSQRGGFETEHEGSRRMKTELLIQMDGLIKKKERVFLLAASNMPWDLDIAMLRRLEKRILVPLPDELGREAMIKKFLHPEIASNLNYQQLAQKTEFYSGSDIKLLCKESAMRPVRRLLNQLESLPQEPLSRKQMAMKSSVTSNADVKAGPVEEADVLEALKSTKPSPVMHLERYKKWEEEYGSLQILFWSHDFD